MKLSKSGESFFSVMGVYVLQCGYRKNKKGTGVMFRTCRNIISEDGEPLYWDTLFSHNRIAKCRVTQGATNPV